MKRKLALLLAAATTISLMGCATSNQKAAETTTAAQTQEAKAETEKAETTEEAEEAESEKAEPETGGYAVQPRSIKDRTLKVGLIPVTMNTAYTMTINGAKKQIEDKGLDIELLVQAPASNTSTITEQGNIMESMIQQGGCHCAGNRKRQFHASISEGSGGSRYSGIPVQYDRA